MAQIEQSSENVSLLKPKQFYKHSKTHAIAIAKKQPLLQTLAYNYFLCGLQRNFLREFGVSRWR